MFEDSLPDDWGRRLMVFDRRLPRGRQGEPFLLRELGQIVALGAINGVVALIVGVKRYWQTLD